MAGAAGVPASVADGPGWVGVTRSGGTHATNLAYPCITTHGRHVTPASGHAPGRVVTPTVTVSDSDSVSVPVTVAGFASVSGATRAADAHAVSRAAYATPLTRDIRARGRGRGAMVDAWQPVPDGWPRATSPPDPAHARPPLARRPRPKPSLVTAADATDRGDDHAPPFTLTRPFARTLAFEAGVGDRIHRPAVHQRRPTANDTTPYRTNAKYSS